MKFHLRMSETIWVKSRILTVAPNRRVRATAGGQNMSLTVIDYVLAVR